MKVKLQNLIGVGIFFFFWAGAPDNKKANTAIQNPIIFVTQVPLTGDFNTSATFGNHLASMQQAPRGGDLWILYPNGQLKNLTKLAGYGTKDASGFQDPNSIAVREPCVNWDGKKAVFSMIVGAASKQYEVKTYYWQLYEISGLGENETPQITKVPNQPTNYNNVSPIYASDGRILFTSDMPHNKQANVHPQLDEYEANPTVTGIWSLNKSTGELRILDHSPSGDFSPTIDSWGRVIFTRWDHLITDGIANLDFNDSTSADKRANAVDFSNETTGATYKDVIQKRGVPDIEIFPEQLVSRKDLLEPGQNYHQMNQFFPWHMNQDGTSLETINHIGRHEIFGYFEYSRTDDPNLKIVANGNDRSIRTGIFQIKEDPNAAGTFYGIDAPEFGYHSSGYILRLTNCMVDPNGHFTNPDNIKLEFVSDKNGAKGFRNPIPLMNGSMLASHSTFDAQDNGQGSASQYGFRLKSLKKQGSFVVPDQLLTSLTPKNISYWDPDQKITYNNLQLWELDPAEVVAKPVPPSMALASSVSSPENKAITDAGVTPAALSEYLKKNNLAIIVTRNVTARDSHDEQQPFNLRVVDKNGVYQPGNAQKVPKPGKVYDISHLQIFQNDLIRGYKGYGKPADMASKPPKPGRRGIATILHDDQSKNIPLATNEPKGAVKIASDGSVAAIVPAGKALSWQLTDTKGKGIVRERYWLTFQPGEIVTCHACHGINTADQEGKPEPDNSPLALTELTKYLNLGTMRTPTMSNTVAISTVEYFPNPTSGEGSLTFINQEIAPVHIQVLNKLGQKVLEQTFTPQSIGKQMVPISLQQLSEGMYFVVLYSKTQDKRIIKVIKS